MNNKDDIYLEIKSHYLTVLYLNEKRRIRVLLPHDYRVDRTLNYPVVYFHDGQNIFHNHESFSGYSWETFATIKNNPDLPQMILVGIDNNGTNRLNQYTPWKVTGNPFAEEMEIGGKGYKYAYFVMEVVKPFIDEIYQTKSSKHYTAMIGSSLGANITAFMGVEYQERIGALGIFSLANWMNEVAYSDYLKEKETDSEQLVYIQVGTEEGNDINYRMEQTMNQTYIDCTLNYTRQLISKGLPIEQINLNIHAGETHTEQAWAQHLPECLRFLSQNW